MSEVAWGDLDRALEVVDLDSRSRGIRGTAVREKRYNLPDPGVHYTGVRTPGAAIHGRTPNPFCHEVHRTALCSAPFCAYLYSLFSFFRRPLTLPCPCDAHLLPCLAHRGELATKVGYFGVKSTNVHLVQMGT